MCSPSMVWGASASGFGKTVTGGNYAMVVSVEDATLEAGSVGIYLATTPQSAAGVLADSYQVSETSAQAESMTG
jgi:hypothetical protein